MNYWIDEYGEVHFYTGDEEFAWKPDEDEKS